MSQTTVNDQLESLTKEQLDTFNSLVRLGDSQELALNTVRAMYPIDNTLNEFAYYN